MPRTVTLRRVVVTGLGAVTDVGLDVPTFWQSLLEGRSGIGPITSFPQTPDWTTRFGGEVRGFDPERHMGVDGREAKRMDRFCLYGLGAAVEAAGTAGWTSPAATSTAAAWPSAAASAASTPSR